MKNIFANRLGGFTLLELMVVVLIIGVLASVAVPQYKKAVYKSRYSKLELLAKEYVEAAKSYHLAAGEWPTEFDEMPLNPSGTSTSPQGNDCRKTGDMFCCLGHAVSGYQGNLISCGLSNYTLFFMQSLDSGQKLCSAKIGDDEASRVCEEVGTFIGTGSGYNAVGPYGHHVVNTYQYN